MLMNLLKLAGAVALLVWGLYMIKTGILRTFGENLRSWLAERLRTRFAGFAAGFGLAALLQSSTASALLVAGLQKKGLSPPPLRFPACLGPISEAPSSFAFLPSTSRLRCPRFSLPAFFSSRGALKRAEDSSGAFCSASPL